MSDVEKTTSGEKISEKSATAAATTTTAVLSSAGAAAITLKQQQQQQQQKQRQQYQHQQHSQQQHHVHYSNKAAAANNVAAENCADDDVSNISTPSLTRHCLSHVLKALFSTPGLVLLVILYSVMGALLFPLLEAPQDITKSVAIAKSREDCLRELWIITEKLNVLYERNWTMLVHEQLRRFEGSIVAATRHGGLSLTQAGLGNNALAGRFGGQMDALQDARWTFSEALLYSVTVITTIGHGSLTPKTSAGKVATILYALIGVPLMLMCLSSLGALLAEALQCTYARICCRLARSGRGSTQQNDARQRCESVDGDDDVTAPAAVSHRSLTETGHHNEYPEQTYELNCKSCKYDAVVGETNLSNGYDYNVNGAAMARAEESCQLLHNSSMSVNHVSPCMQLKSATMGANVQYFQQRGNNAYVQQQQQQHQQQQHQQQQHQQQQHSPYEQQHSHPQHSDVMHMSSACADTTTASNSSLLSQKFSQPSTATSTYCSRSATPSPQHLQHPLQQNYHIVTSSTPPHSSPTHTGYVRQNPMQQHHLQQQQHFVAVPSNVVRFQTTAVAGAAPSKGGDMLNFYQPASVAVTGSATIYFPISAATPATTTTASASGAHGTQLLYNQPLVKYHTIQLQHKKPPSYVVADATLSAATSQGQVTFATATTTAAECGTMPLPPPPAYQTATVHGIRRAKFLTKPMPQGINTLMAENDLSCRHDMSQHCNTSGAEPATASSTANSAHSTSSTLSALTSLCSATFTTTTTTTTSIPTRSVGLGMATTAATMPSTSLCHTAAVDIMEDEEENEQQRIGNCPHGTPSRVPLISGAGSDDNAYSSDDKGKSGSGAKSSGMLSRSLMNSTAASFHRHTLHTFHRSGNRKSTMAARRSCRLHRSSAGRTAMLSGSSGGCYGDTTETSDDDDYLAHGSTDFVLNDGDEEEGSEDDAACESQHATDGPQVPITIVLLILICYICLGTVIFAFWENWSLIDGAYFCFVTLSTIGYGDFLPERTFNGPEVQLFACCAYLLLGLVLVAMSFSILETQLMWKCKRIAVRLKLAKD